MANSPGNAQVVGAQVAALVGAQATVQGQLIAWAATLAATSAKAFTGWYDSKKIGPWASELASLIQGFQSQAASGTDAYLTELASEMTGRKYSPAGTIKVTDLRNGANPVEVYGRVADTYRYQTSLGKEPTAALQIAATRAEILAETDIALAARAQARKFMVVKNVEGWRRVIHPELTRSGTCGLCIVAADRIYHRSELMPIHDRCVCTVSPVINGVDPGYSLNRSDLQALYKLVGGTQAKQLSNARIAVHHHGELGPVLTVRGQHFRSASDVAAA